MAHWNPNGKLAVVTGASSGIGKSLCLQLARLGCDLIAVARRDQRLQELRTEINETAGAGPSSEIHCVVGDITAAETQQEILSQVQTLDRPLDLLVNNAGIGGIGAFENASESRLRQIMEVNFFAPVELTRTLLPYLKSSSDSVICNIGSVLGHRAVPDKSEYCASKFAMHGWSDALRAELAGGPVSVTLVSPSTTRSEFFDSLVESEGASSKSLGSWPPDKVATATIKAIRRRRAEVVLSAGGKLLVYTDRICPPLMNWALQKKV